MNKRMRRFIDFIFIAMFLVAFIFLARSCRAADEVIPQHLIDALIERREAIRPWALTCPEGSPYAGQYSIYDNMCWQGDMTCYAGLCCLAAKLAGDEETFIARYEDVIAAQEPGGRWVRGPMFVGKNYGEGQNPDPPDFSRDQTRGIFAMLIALGYLNPDEAELAMAQDVAMRWLAWVIANDEKICLEDKRTCELTVGTHNMFYNVFTRLGITPQYYGKEERLVRKWYRSRWYYRWGFLAETRLLPIDEKFRDKWYPRHLKANTLLMYRVLNMNPVTKRLWNRRMARVFGKAARRIYRGDPTNPLYRLMYEGVTVDLVEQVLDKYTSPVKASPETRPHDWAWQRHTSEEAWTRSDGHDSIYLINLILAKVQGGIVW